MKIKCLWKGCKGIIDLSKEFRDFQKSLGELKEQPAEIPWCIHSIICPKCHNSIGGIDIKPGYWIEITGNNKTTINDPISKKSIELSIEVPKYLPIKEKQLDPYLKHWARSNYRQKELKK